jgi:hypothetical protein
MMMMKSLLRAVLAIAGLSVLALAGAREVQAQTMFGAEAMVGTDTEFGLGGRVHFDLAPSVPNLEIMGSFDYFFPDGPTDRSATEDDTDVGLNLGGGVRFLFANTIPFLEARVTIGGVEQLVIGGGVLFGRF